MDDVRKELRRSFPAVPPPEFSWDDVEPALGPEEWARRHLDAGAALAEQVTRPVDAGVLDAILMALGLVIAGKGDDAIVELARRQWNGIASGTAFDVAAYRRAVQKMHPGLDLSAAGASSAYDVVRILQSLQQSRQRVGLPSAAFLWLRAVDRRLWYAIDNLGRNAYHIEGVGPIIQMQAEERAAGPLPVIDLLSELDVGA